MTITGTIDKVGSMKLDDIKKHIKDELEENPDLGTFELKDYEIFTSREEYDTDKDDDDDRLEAGWIVLIVLGSLTIIVLLGVLLCFCCRKKRR